MTDLYSNCQFPELHPDPVINNEILIEILRANLDIARCALSVALAMNVVTPAAIAMKQNVRWALDETHPSRIGEQHNNHG